MAQNTKIWTEAWDNTVPSRPLVLGSLVLTPLLLAILNVQPIFERFGAGSEYLLAGRGATTGLLRYLTETVPTDIWARVSVFTGWALIGAAFYGVLWLFLRVAIDWHNNQVFITSYTHPGNFRVLRYLAEIAVAGLLRAMAITTLILTILLGLRLVLPVASLLLRDWLYNLTEVVGWGSLVLSLLLTWIGLMALIVFGRLFITTLRLR